MRAERLRLTLKSNNAELECDLHAVRMVIEERKGRAYMPAYFLFADHASGAVVHQKLGHPDGREQMAQSELLAALEQLGARPGGHHHLEGRAHDMHLPAPAP